MSDKTKTVLGIVVLCLVFYFIFKDKLKYEFESDADRKYGHSTEKDGGDMGVYNDVMDSPSKIKGKTIKEKLYSELDKYDQRGLKVQRLFCQTIPLDLIDELGYKVIVYYKIGENRYSFQWWYTIHDQAVQEMAWMKNENEYFQKWEDLRKRFRQ